MKQLVRQTGRLFRRNVFLVSCFGILLVLINGIELYLCRSGLQHPLSFLQSNQSFGLLVYLFFMVIGFEFFGVSGKSNLNEVHQTVSRGELRFRICQGLILFLLLLIVIADFLVWETMVYFKSGMHYAPYYWHILKNYALNFFFSGLIAGMIGYLLAAKCKKTAAYLAIVILAFLSSPISAQIPVIFDMILPYGASVPIYRFFDLFALCPRGLDSIVDYAYGIPMEPYRWQIALFSVFLLIGLILVMEWKRRLKTVWKALGVAVLALSLICGSLSFLRGSVQIDDERPDGTVLFDQMYYIDHPGKTQAADFDISAYRMKLAITNRLKADITMELSAAEPQKKYFFTLHRSMHIKSVTDENGKSLSFTRDGDYLDVYPSDRTEIPRIRIVYEGFSPIFHTNRQGVCLPGYYSYYPMEGYHVIYGMGYRVDTYFKEKSFDVEVESRHELISNLTKQSNGHFTGRSDSMTFVSGFLREENVEGARIWNYALLPYQDQEELSKLPAAIEAYNQLLGTNVSYPLEGKTIIHTNYNSPMDAVFSDHIVGSTIVATEVAGGLIDRTIPVDPVKAPLRELLIKELRFGGTIEDWANSDFDSDKTKLARQVLQKTGEHGEPAVYRAIYDYLIDENNHQSPEQFLNRLGWKG